jgi:hypothetical protein
MLRALLHNQEPGRICDIVQPGNEFEVHSNFTWIDVPDDTTTTDRYNEADGTIIKHDLASDPVFAENAYKLARGIAYGSPGEQLDMLFHELKATGSISSTGTWATHIAIVKTNIPKDDPVAVLAWNKAQYDAVMATITTSTQQI